MKPNRFANSSPILLAALVLVASSLFQPSPLTAAEKQLPGTALLTLDRPLDELMVKGIQQFFLGEIEQAAKDRSRAWKQFQSIAGGHEGILQRKRNRFLSTLGAIDKRLTQAAAGAGEFTFLGDLPIATTSTTRVQAIRWRVLEGVTAVGLLLTPQQPRAAVIALPDADWTPSMFAGLRGPLPSQVQLARRLADAGCLVVVPLLINRSDEHSGHPDVRYTNQPHREFLYRQAFQVGRHVIGYEVQKVLAAVDLLSELHADGQQLPIGVAGIGEGGLLSLYSAAADTRIQSALVSGYFQDRSNVWQEPIYRNVWGSLREFADADLANLILPRSLTIEACAAPQVSGPPAVRKGRYDTAAPGTITHCKLDSVRSEVRKAQEQCLRKREADQLTLAVSGTSGQGPSGSDEAIRAFLLGLGIDTVPNTGKVDWKLSESLAARSLVTAQVEQEQHHRQFQQLQDHVQSLMEASSDFRDQSWQLTAKSPEEAAQFVHTRRREVHRQIIGQLTQKRLAPQARSRQVLETEGYTGYEVVIDVFADIIAGGILLLPKDLRPGERRPVVVCQHGLEGTAMDTISSKANAFRFYKSFSARLCERGFIVYAPQNPYRGKDQFRVIQRMANPLAQSLFSVIITQHEQTLDWLTSLEMVDPDRIAFYGLSYGGKTAMRVPPFVTRYCLSICSGDFTDWTRVIATNKDRYGYIFTSEYEIFEWNQGHVASYAELAMLMTPRPFMVEQGLQDGGTPVEWVRSEYSKVRRHYDQLGIGSRSEIEFFDGPHTIHGVGTFRFLHKHLDWPEPGVKQGP